MAPNFPSRRWVFGVDGLPRSERNALTVSGAIEPTGQLEPREDSAQVKKVITIEKKREFIEKRAWDVALQPGKQFMMTGVGFQDLFPDIFNSRLISLYDVDDGLWCSYHEHNLHFLPADGPHSWVDVHWTWYSCSYDFTPIKTCLQLSRLLKRLRRNCALICSSTNSFSLHANLECCYILRTGLNFE